jgi:hypothetical protein
LAGQRDVAYEFAPKPPDHGIRWKTPAPGKFGAGIDTET